jgi:hypothetical protein
MIQPVEWVIGPVRSGTTPGLKKQNSRNSRRRYEAPGQTKLIGIF